MLLILKGYFLEICTAKVLWKVFRMVSVGSFLRISLTFLEANLNFVRLDSLTFQAT